MDEYVGITVDTKLMQSESWISWKQNIVKNKIKCFELGRK